MFSRRLVSRAFSSARALSSKFYEVNVKTPFVLHNFEQGPPMTTTTTREELLKYFREMYEMRRMEIECDNLYKAALVRGFCHLYDGQEAVCAGIEAGLIPGDSLITAYRDHCQMLMRGGTLEGVIGELLGREIGHSKGKGGSMHFYSSKHNFYGGNGIVGAQVPVGVGVALKHQYSNDGHVNVAMFGDGAANQGQVYEALNMAWLWKLPVIYVCENNGFGMGTSIARAAANPDFFRRGDIVPGMRVDGMDVFAVREAIKFSAEHCRSGKGPVYLEMATYRYHGHSMSDPGTSYRTRDDIQKVRDTRDPIAQVKERILDLSAATEAELKEIEQEVRERVTIATEKAKNAKQPDEAQLLLDVYPNNSQPVRDSSGKLHVLG